jgi:hypothetical protein
MKPKNQDRLPLLSIAPGAQRVVLYDEDPSDPKGKQYVGSVIWRTEQVEASGNQKSDIAVRADVRSTTHSWPGGSIRLLRRRTVRRPKELTAVSLTRGWYAT